MMSGPINASEAAGRASSPPEDERFVAARRQMVRQQIAARGIDKADVLRAMRTTPRHAFVPEPIRHMAYSDQPLPIGEHQTISQPFIVAAMTQLVQPEAGDVVLEVGTGSGYQAAVLAEIVQEVYSIEIVEPLGHQAADTLERLGYTNVTVRVGDGYAGWEEHAPFDGVLVTAAATHVPQPLVEQLKPGARMVMPVGPDGGLQYLMVIEKQEDGTTRQWREFPVAFVPLTGDRAQP